MSDNSKYAEALMLIGGLLDRAGQTPLKEPTAMSLATADASGRPSVRIVLLRGIDDRGFVFFTNSRSRKGQELQENPHAALCLFWDALEEQVRIEGSVERVSDEESDDYWATRSRDSQLGAWASQQSQTLDARETLENRVIEIKKKYGEGPIPRPPHWYGFRIVPNRIEFWHGRPARLHERTVYEYDGQNWTVRMLYP